MAKYRIASVQWWTVFGEPVTSPTVQKRVGFFWWVTLTHCESVKQAMTYIRNVENRKPEKVLGIIVKKAPIGAFFIPNPPCYTRSIKHEDMTCRPKSLKF